MKLIQPFHEIYVLMDFTGIIQLFEIIIFIFAEIAETMIFF